MLWVVVLRLFFVDMRLPPYSVSLICIVCSCFYVKLMQINYYDTCVIIDYLTWFDGLHARCDM